PEGWARRHVDDLAALQPVGPDPEPAVGADREVPKGMGRRPGRPGRQQDGGQDGQGCDPVGEPAHRPLVWLGAGRWSRPARASAVGWSRTVREGEMANALARWRRAAAGMPRSASTAARWYQSRASRVP